MTHDDSHSELVAAQASPRVQDVDVVGRAPLESDRRAGVCVIGAGVARGETGRTTARLANAMDDHPYDLEKAFGAERLRLAVESHGAAIDCIGRTAARRLVVDAHVSRVAGGASPWIRAASGCCVRAPAVVVATDESASWYQDAFDELCHYAELFTNGDVDHADAIDQGEGAVIRRGLARLAVDRDEHDRLHEPAAICPCHGSRFFHDGSVAGGPARTGCRNRAARPCSMQRSRR